LLKNIYPLTTTIDYSSGATKSVEIPQSGYITELNVLFNLNITAATSVTAAEDAVARIINAARLTASGAKNFFDVSDGRQWYYWNFFNYEGQVSGDSLPAAGATTDVTLLLTIHWGLDPYVDTDRTIVLPSPELQNINLEIDWAAQTALGTGYTINASSTKAYVEVTELALEQGEMRNSIWQTLLSPRFEAREISVTSTYSNLALEKEVPVGDVLYQTVVMILDASGDRSNTYVSEFGIKYPKERRTPFKRKLNSLRAIARRQFRTTATATGTFMLPWSDLTDKEKGIDLRGAQVGDVKTGYTVDTANGTVHELHYAFG
jgi:hypothetical protein